VPPDRHYGLLASGVQAYRIETKLDAVLAQLGIVLKDESLVLKMETTNMSAISDFATTVKQKLDDQQTKLQSLSDRINAVIANGSLSDADKASLQGIADEVDQHNSEIDTFAQDTVAPAAAA
jgi:hypothetical protein